MGYINIKKNSFKLIRNKNVVLVSEDNFRNLIETLYLSSIPGYVENINEIRTNEVWKNCEEYKKMI